MDDEEAQKLVRQLEKFYTKRGMEHRVRQVPGIVEDHIEMYGGVEEATMALEQSLQSKYGMGLADVESLASEWDPDEEQAAPGACGCSADCTCSEFWISVHDQRFIDFCEKHKKKEHQRKRRAARRRRRRPNAAGMLAGDGGYESDGVERVGELKPVFLTHRTGSLVTGDYHEGLSDPVNFSACVPWPLGVDERIPKGHHIDAWRLRWTELDEDDPASADLAFPLPRREIIFVADERQGKWKKWWPDDCGFQSYRDRKTALKAAEKFMTRKGIKKPPPELDSGRAERTKPKRAGGDGFEDFDALPTLIPAIDEHRYIKAILDSKRFVPAVVQKRPSSRGKSKK